MTKSSCSTPFSTMFPIDPIVYKSAGSGHDVLCVLSGFAALRDAMWAAEFLAAVAWPLLPSAGCYQNEFVLCIQLHSILNLKLLALLDIESTQGTTEINLER